jgi:CheY-like chemotaxis protein
MLTTPPLPGARPARRLKVLLVDDNVELATVLGTWLGAAGHEVHHVSSGHDAMIALADLRPDAVVTDIFMAGGNGVEVISRAHGLVPRPRIIAMSGGSPIMEAEDCLDVARKAGADVCLPKPFSPRELVAVLEGDGGRG